MTGAHLFSERVEHSWSNSVLYSSSWTVSCTVLGTLTHFSSGTWWHCSSKSWWHSFLVSWACWQSFLYWRLHCLRVTVSWTGRCEIWHLRSWTLAQAVSATSWHSFLVTVSYLGLLAVLLVLEAALSPGHGLLDRPLRDLALALLDVGAGGVGHLLALLPGHRLVLGPGHLLAHLLGHLPALGLGGAHHGRRVELQGEVGDHQDQDGGEESLHDDALILAGVQM